MGLAPPAGCSADFAAAWEGAVDQFRFDADEPVEQVELLRAWCQTTTELRAAEEWVAEHGTTMEIRDDKGQVKSVAQAPKYVQARALRLDLVKLAKELTTLRMTRQRSGKIPRR
jgi:phage terminase small subunit